MWTISFSSMARSQAEHHEKKKYKEIYQIGWKKWYVWKKVLFILQKFFVKD